MKLKNFIVDVFFNTFSFAIYIIAQQIVFMPVMGKWLSEEDFALLVMYISIFAIISNALGSELGIVRQVRDDQNSQNYNRILLYLFPIVIIVSISILLILKFSIINSILLTIPILLANIRLYSASFFRLNKNFKKVLIQNVLYLIGIILGILIYKRNQYIWIPMLVAETLPLIYNIFNTDILKNGIKKDKNNKSIWKTFLDLSFISLLINGMVYFDKILIYPILGNLAVSIYYATSTMSKIISLIVNPLHGVILSWLKEDKEKNRIVKFAIKINIPIILLVFVVSMPLTYLAVKILYVQYLAQAITLIIPVCIGLAFYTATTLIKSLLLKYIESKKLVKTYLIYFIIFIVIAIPMSKFWGLLGFAYANVISKVILWIQFLWVLKKIMKEQTKDKE